MNFHWFLPSRMGIPVLMYHRVWPDLKDRITVTPKQLRAQWAYLKESGYRALSLPEFLAMIRGEKSYSPGSILITFDDGYYNNLTYAVPLLSEFGFQATFFIIADVLEGKTFSEDPLNRKMNADELRSLPGSLVQLAMHGHRHEHFGTTPLPEVMNALRESMRLFRDAHIRLHPSLAYPYGGRPRVKKDLDRLKQWMAENGIDSAFRIGNQICPVPARDLYEIKRIDIRGTDRLRDFKIKLKKGKLNPF